MIYKDFQNLKLSSIAMGAMRLPVLSNGEINETETAEMVDYAIKNGVNYFDTAYGYHNGKSEIVMGKILKKYPREKFFLADKFPGYDLSNMDKVEKIFEEQLKKCGVEYFDFYMFHNVCEMNINAYTDEKYGIYDYLIKQKENGRIKHLGFSAHGSYSVIERFLKAYGSKMEFCQIQLNFLDWEFQDAKSKIELLKNYNIPVWVMEPLRGGKLANVSDDDIKKLNSLRPDKSIVEWSFRFLQSIPEVKTILSGASSIEQIKQNIQIFNTEEPLNEEETQTLLSIADNMVKKIVLPCTECRYCVTHCIQKLDIPNLLSLYNEHCFTGEGLAFIAPMALMAMPKEKQPNACIGCKSCEAVCPQQIKISDAMADFSKKLGLFKPTI